MAGVVVSVATVPDIPLAETTDTDVTVPEPPAAQVKTPLPLVCKNWLASPSLAGKVIVQVPAISAVFKVTVPLVVPLISIEPVATPAPPKDIFLVVIKVDPREPVLELKVSPAFVLGAKSPVADIKKQGKQFSSVASLATVIAETPETVAETNTLPEAEATFMFLNSGVTALVTPIKQCF